MKKSITPHYPETTTADLSVLERLSSRQLRILRLAQQDLTCEQIANHLNISVLTVKKHRCNILKELGLCGKRGFRQAIRSLGRWPTP